IPHAERRHESCSQQSARGSRRSARGSQQAANRRRPSTVDNALAGDSAIIFRKLLQLRLLVLAVLLGFLGLLDTLSNWPLNYPVILLVITCGIGWSLWLLSRDAGPVQAQQILRELVIDGVWLALVVYCSGRSE